jgi:hypothetical protein
MKKILLSLLLCTTFAVASTPDPAAYTITVHVIASTSRGISEGQNNYGGNEEQRLQVVIDGKKYELQGFSRGVLALGDYKAKLTETHRNSYDINQAYQFLMPDGKTRNFTLIGIPAQ